MGRRVPGTIIGRREGGDPGDPLEHFHVCEGCGQPVDRRDLGAVLHHEDSGHAPLPEAEAFRLLTVEDWPRARLLGTPVGRAN
jgi:hypothetical protein